MTDRTDRTDCPAFELLAIAHHEAGHAIAQLLVSPSLPFLSVSIVSEYGDLGRATFENYEDLIVPDTDGEDAEVSEHERQFIESEAISSLAGPLAEQRFRGERLGPPLPGSASTDEAYVRGLAHHLHDDHREAHAWQWSMLGRAVRMIEDGRNWKAIVAVASALLRQKTLDGSEVEKLVRRAQNRR
jgi:hypothetical protein